MVSMGYSDESDIIGFNLLDVLVDKSTFFNQVDEFIHRIDRSCEQDDIKEGRKERKKSIGRETDQRSRIQCNRSAAIHFLTIRFEDQQILMQ